MKMPSFRQPLARRRLPSLPAPALGCLRSLCLTVGAVLALLSVLLLYFYWSAAPIAAPGGAGEPAKQGILSFGFGEVLVGGFAALLLRVAAPWLGRARQARRLGRWPDEA